MSIIKNGLNKLFCFLQEKHDERQLFRLRSEMLKLVSLGAKEQGVSEKPLCDKEVIVSLTTYDKRYYDVYLTIESIMQGTVKPNRIILWLADEMKNGLEIRPVKGSVLRLVAKDGSGFFDLSDSEIASLLKPFLGEMKI